MKKNIRFHYVMSVWGRNYVDHMLRVAIPCLLSYNNLPSMQNNHSSVFYIYTTEEDKEKIKIADSYINLNKLINVEIIISPEINTNIPYHLKASSLQKKAAILAAEFNAYCIFLAPDFIISDGSLNFLYNQALIGKEAVMIPGLRVNTDEILLDLAILKDQFINKVINLKSRDLVKLALKHIHIEDLRYNWSNKYFSQSPVVCTWNVPGEEGYLIRAFHLHPILLKMNNIDSVTLLDQNTIDGNFIGLNILDWNLIHVECDSDNIVMFSLTDKKDRNWPLIENTSSEIGLATTAYSVLCNPLHRLYFTKAIKLHVNELNNNWTMIENKTGLISYNVLSFLNDTNPFTNIDYMSTKIRINILFILLLKKFIRKISFIFNKLNLFIFRKRKINKYNELKENYDKLFNEFIELKNKSL